MALIKHRFQGWQVSLATLWLAALTQAQLPVPEVHSLQPPLVKAGTTTELNLTGANLEDLTHLHFSLSGLSGKPILLPSNEFRKNPGQNGLKFSVTVPADLPPQMVEVRAAGWHGISTSRPLVIVSPSRQILQDSAGAAHHKIETAPELPREAMAWGTCDARQTDWWRFSAKKGERLIIACQAEQIDSLVDATLRIVDEKGHELTSNRDFVGRDPMVDFTAPADGNFWVGVHDFLYNGGSPYFYLLEITARPWIDAVFPAAGPAGQSYTATLIGRNLPGGSLGENLFIDRKPVEVLEVQVKVPTHPPDHFFDPDLPSRALVASFPFQWKESNVIRLGFSDYPIQPVPEDNDEAPAAEVPVEFVSRFHKENDADYFRFRAKQGTEYYIEVIGDRISGRMDPYLFVDAVEKKPDGSESFQRVKDGDDQPSKGGPTFRDDERDTVLSLKADKDREYRVGIINQYASAGPEKIYRLIIRPAQPDFEVLAIGERDFLDQRQAFPAMPHLRQGGTFSPRLAIHRKDGWSEPITISAEGLPEGVHCHPVTFAAKESSGRIVFNALPEAKNWSGDIRLWASSKSGENEVRHPIRFGALVWSANDYNTARIRPRLNLGVPLSVETREKSPASIQVKTREFTVEIGQKLEIPFAVTKHEAKGPLAVTFSGLRGLQKPPSVNVDEKASEGKMVLEFKDQNGVFAPEPGRWNFVLQGSGVTKYRNNLPALERVETESREMADLVKKYSDESNQAKVDLAEKQKKVAETEKNLGTASPEERANLEKAAAEARSLHDAAVKNAAEAEKKRTTAEQEKVAADKRLQAAKTASTPKDLRFVAWSEPLVVEIKPAPEAAKK